MTWTHTSRGRALDLLNPVAADIDLNEIGRALGHQCRYNGCLTHFYSVAEHSVHMARYFLDIGDHESALGALLHDAAEAYTGDISHPVQEVLFRDNDKARLAYQQMQMRLDMLIAEKVGCGVTLLHSPKVREADLRILLDERERLLVGRPRPWAVESMQPLGVRIQCWTPQEATRRWFNLFLQLRGYLGRAAPFEVTHG